MRIDYPRRAHTGVRHFLPSWRQLLSLGVLGALAVLGALVLAYSLTDVPDEENELARAQASVITWSDGGEIGRYGAQNRIAVSLGDLPEHVGQAVLAAEDRGFYDNSGVSPTAIVRSAWNNLTTDTTQGGSTLTQQYVKNVYLTQERTLSRKAREFFVALKVDRQLSKDEILEGYLNTIYWGRSAYGIETAAQSYYGVGAKDLTLEQAAYLAGIIQAPGNYDAATDPGPAQVRFDYVLDGMVEQGWLDAGARAEMVLPVPIEREATDRLAGTKGYLMDTARRELLRIGYTEQDIDLGGLRVRTTFDPKIQGAAEGAIAALLAEAPPEDIELHSALVAVRPGDGAVAAMYGGQDFLTQSFNDATQGATQPGSTFKPFGLVAGLEQGIGLRSRFDGNSGRSFPEYENGRPVPNFGDTDFGRIDLLKATASSVNTVYVELGLEAGPQNVVDAAVEAGIPADTTDLNANPSVVLGVANTHPIDMAEAYATFAAQGLHADAYTVMDVVLPNGGVDYQARPQPQQAFSADVMADATFALQGVVRNGSGGAARELGRPVAGKTGTTNGNRSAWFAGYVPQLAAVVAMWDGDDDPGLNGYGGRSTVTGGSFPAEIWTAFMQGALDGVEELDFPEPVYVGEERDAEPTAPPSPSETPTPSPSPTTPSPSPSPTASASSASPTPTATSLPLDPPPRLPGDGLDPSPPPQGGG